MAPIRSQEQEASKPGEKERNLPQRQRHTGHPRSALKTNNTRSRDDGTETNGRHTILLVGMAQPLAAQAAGTTGTMLPTAGGREKMAGMAA